MKHIIFFLIIMVVSCVGQGSPNDYNHALEDAKTIAMFKQQGGSSQGVEILTMAFAKKNESLGVKFLTMYMNKAIVLQKEIQQLVIDENFNATAFKDKSDDLYDILSTKRNKLLSMQSKILKAMSVQDRKIYLHVLQQQDGVILP